MKNLRLSFDNGGLRIHPNEEVDGIDSEAQNALLNIGTIRGSDPIFPQRGTGIFLRGLQGKLGSRQAAIHEANFAAIDTLFFLRDTDPHTTNDKLSEVKLQVTEFSLGRLSLNALMTTLSGATVGVDLTV